MILIYQIPNSGQANGQVLCVPQVDLPMGNLGVVYSASNGTPTLSDSSVLGFAGNRYKAFRPYIVHLPIDDITEDVYVRAYHIGGAAVITYSTNVEIYSPIVPQFELRDLVGNQDSAIDFGEFAVDFSVFIEEASVTFNFSEGWSWFFIPSLELGTELSEIFAEHIDKISLVKNLPGYVWWALYDFDGIGEVSTFQTFNIQCFEPFTLTFPLDTETENLGEYSNEATQFPMLAPTAIALSDFLENFEFEPETPANSGQGIPLTNLNNKKYGALIDPDSHELVGGNLLNLSPNGLYWIKAQALAPIPNHQWNGSSDQQENHTYMHPEGYAPDNAFLHIPLDIIEEYGIEHVDVMSVTFEYGGSATVNPDSTLDLVLPICLYNTGDVDFEAAGIFMASQVDIYFNTSDPDVQVPIRQFGANATTSLNQIDSINKGQIYTAVTSQI